MTIHVGVAYATPVRQAWIKFEVPNGSTIADAIEQSGILRQFPDIDLEEQKVGIYGKVKPLTTKLSEGDRVEIYRPITADPEPILQKEQEKKKKASGDKAAKIAAMKAKKEAALKAKAEQEAETSEPKKDA